ncbi:hypothetical protein BDF20DRAFT_842543 [Mycotypha africana]|uniref:uncharacterized protein n=1 Tax=Mycotypha africana TaxID=64632 RepID=UPI002301E0F5|nr:uncharacterized protein BDF20DRAFT_842543 [Mycotypha africana]KAI8991081.1 hypothetical protein BDF20DRAFT_842543 [Mycotypha africana]
MGQFISSLNLRPGEALVPELGFDIENATPSHDELQLYNKLSALLVRPGPTLLSLLKSYVPASEQIRDAIAKPTHENETRAWDAVAPTVDILREIYDYSADLQEGLPELLSVLCQGDVNKNLETNQGLAKLFAELLDFVFEFDHLKMRSPTLQNDFSYYRRMLQRGRYSSSSNNNNHPTNSSSSHSNAMSDLRSAMIEDDQANRISLFIAYPTPMLKCIIDTTTTFVNNNKLQKSVGDWLAALWATCFNTVSKKRNQNPQIAAFCMKVMVVSIILYDHIDPNGAFYKNSPINIKNSVKIIQSVPTTLNLSASSTSTNTHHGGNSSSSSSSSSSTSSRSRLLTSEYSSTNLLSALKYNSKHLNDETTPKGVKNLVLAT